MKYKLKIWFRKYLLHFLPSRLPVGMTEFDRWAGEIIETYGAPDNDTFRGMLAVTIMHLEPKGVYYCKRYYAKVMLKGMANEIANAKFEGYKLARIAKAKADQEAAAAEAAATALPPLNVQQ